MPKPKTQTKIRTDETLHEIIQHGNAAFPVQYYYEDIWDFDFHCIDWHWHHELEYVYVKTGSAFCFIGQDKVVVDAGCGILINSRVVHRFEASTSTIIPNLVFSPSLLATEESLLYRQAIQPILSSGVSYVILSADVPWQAACLQQMQKVFSYLEKDEPDPMQVVIATMLFWHELAENLQQCRTPAGVEQENTSQIRLQLMLQYIQKHYHEKIRLDDIANAVHIGKSTMMQIFQRYIHQSPVAYLIQYRLRKAAVLLKTTEKSIADIACETGFEGATYFCRRFKESYRMTPMMYRKNK